MENLNIGFAENGELDEVVRLGKKFESEKCCNGIIADDKEYFSDKKVVIAKLNDTVAGYCYGKFEIKQKDAGKFKKGQKIFYVEELYVDKPYRGEKIGHKLFSFVENYAKENGCEWIETTAVSKNYKALLSFYIDKLNMEFWSAEIIKKL